jgi:hypothetical protein
MRLAMQRLWLTGQVLPVGARLVAQHVFQSDEERPLEVIYSFPLPRDAALRRFRITGDGFETHSELKETEEAVKAYEQGIADGSLSALARQYGDGIVNLTVGNIRPKEKVTVHVEVLTGVELRDDGFRFRFPFTLAPAYHSKMRAAVTREVVTKIHGRHELRIGGEAVRLSNHIVNTFQMAGNFQFNGQLSGNGLADFMFGRTSLFRQGGGEFKYLKDLKGTRWGFFAQDNWRVTQRLMLNLGVRWDPYIPYYDREGGRAVCFQPNTTQRSKRYPNAPLGLLYGGENYDPGCFPGGSKNNWWNIGPRVWLRLSADPGW